MYQNPITPYTYMYLHTYLCESDESPVGNISSYPSNRWISNNPIFVGQNWAMPAYGPQANTFHQFVSAPKTSFCACAWLLACIPIYIYMYADLYIWTLLFVYLFLFFLLFVFYIFPLLSFLRRTQYFFCFFFCFYSLKKCLRAWMNVCMYAFLEISICKLYTYVYKFTLVYKCLYVCLYVMCRCAP